jgi:hypothetical protein
VRIASVVLAFLVLAPLAARAEDALPAALDPAMRPSKKNRAELSVYGGSLLGASLQKTFLAGVRAYWHINPTWAVGVDGAYSRLFDGGVRAIGGSVSSRDIGFVDAEVLISNDVALRAGRHVVPLDLFLTAGVGAMSLAGRWEPLGKVGGGIRAYIGVPWLSPRVDLATLIHPVRHPGWTAVDVDVALMAGVSFLLPADGGHL